MDSDEIEEKLEDCIEAKACSNFESFNKWECDFIDSIYGQFQDMGSLTEPQKETLIEIWDKI